VLSKAELEKQKNARVIDQMNMIITDLKDNKKDFTVFMEEFRKHQA
jgi:hypothetical protein